MTSLTETQLSLLAADAYARDADGENPLPVPAGAELLAVDFELAFHPAGFAAVAYILDGEVVISYRGTDGILMDIVGGWPAGTDHPEVSIQAYHAVEFYKAVVAQYGPDVVLTGHSLGGGLAGFVAALYDQDAVVFSHMPFMEGVQALHDMCADPQTQFQQEWRDLIYGDGNPVRPLDFSGISATHLPGEVVSAVRLLAGDTSSQALNMFGAELVEGAVERHMLSTLLTLRQYGDADQGYVDQSNWQDGFRFFWPTLFDDELASNAGVTLAVQDLYGSSNAHSALITAIAYSFDADDPQTQSIEVLFDDLGDLGLASQFWLGDIEAIQVAEVVLQFSGAAAVFDGSVGAAGVLSWSASGIAVSFEESIWAGVGSGAAAAASAAKSRFLEAVLKPEFGDEAFVEADFLALSESIEEVVFLLGADGWFAGSVTTAAAGAHVGTALSDEILGSSANDVIFGGGGDDILFGGEGDDYLVGGEGIDTVFVEELQVTVDLSTATGQDTIRFEVSEEGGTTDTLVGIERMELSWQDDSVTTTGLVDVELYINLGDGRDTVDLSPSLAGVTLQGTANPLGLGGLSVSNAEIIIGSEFDDEFSWHDDAGGSATLYGGWGEDTFAFSAGSSHLACGEGGGDTFIFNGGASHLASGGDGQDEFTVALGGAPVVLWGGSDADTFNFTGGGDILCLYISDLTEEQFLNIDLNSLLVQVQQLLPDAPEAILINPEETDALYLDGLQASGGAYAQLFSGVFPGIGPVEINGAVDDHFSYFPGPPWESNLSTVHIGTYAPPSQAGGMPEFGLNMWRIAGFQQGALGISVTGSGPGGYIGDDHMPMPYFGEPGWDEYQLSIDYDSINRSQLASSDYSFA